MANDKNADQKTDAAKAEAERIALENAKRANDGGEEASKAEGVRRARQEADTYRHGDRPAARPAHGTQAGIGADRRPARGPRDDDDEYDRELDGTYGDLDARRDDGRTHLLVKSRRSPGFRRAGLSFSSDRYTVLDIADLTPETIRALEAEESLSVRRISAADARNYTDAAAIVTQEMSPAAMAQALVRMDQEIRALREQIEQRDRAAGDRPPVRPDARNPLLG